MRRLWKTEDEEAKKNHINHLNTRQQQINTFMDKGYLNYLINKENLLDSVPKPKLYQKNKYKENCSFERKPELKKIHLKNPQS